jgi:hypothetical protein
MVILTSTYRKKQNNDKGKKKSFHDNFLLHGKIQI